MKHVVVILIAFAFSLSVSAQTKAVIEFKEKDHDFGKIKESDGLASFDFVFTNTGNAPLILNNVQASCGCTSPEWTREQILPKATGKIKVTYNPQGRPGVFTKQISVTSNSEPPLAVLTIKGEVVQREPTIEELYPRQKGAIRLKSDYSSIGSLKNTEVKTDVIELINTSDKPVKLNIHGTPAAYLTVTIVPEVVEPNKTAKISITYDGTKQTKWGYSTDRIYFDIDGKADYNYSIGIQSSVVEDFSKLTPDEVKNAPIFTIPDAEKVFDFGKLSQGDKVSHVFKIANTGKRDLLIRDIQTSCGCTAAITDKKIIKAGESTELKVEFNSSGKSGSQNKAITLTSNDPKNSTVSFRVIGNVVPPATVPVPATAPAK